MEIAYNNNKAKKFYEENVYYKKRIQTTNITDKT